MIVIPVHLNNQGEFGGSLIYRTKDSVVHFYKYYSAMPSMGDEQHDLYFLSDEAPEDGDWYADKGTSAGRINGTGYVQRGPVEWCHKHKYKKVVATTDQELHKWGVPGIPEKYVRKFAHSNGDVLPVELEMSDVMLHKDGNGGVLTNLPKLVRVENLPVREVVVVYPKIPEEMYEDSPTDHEIIEFMINYYKWVYDLMCWLWAKKFKY